ncbi:MAG: MBL fold metallo-hydrolase [Thermoplasmata archaeon]|nr:MBL fold metallo-hydrolase [Thermoplasmata archaeon]
MTSPSLPLCEAWFEIEVAGNGLFRITEPHVDALLRANAWLQIGKDRDLLVDTGNGLAAVLPVVQRLRREPTKPLVAFATHSHQDHAGGLYEFDDRWIHAADAAAAAAPGRLLFRDDVGAATRQLITDAGLSLPELLIEALPTREFDPLEFLPHPAYATRKVEEGSPLSLGDRTFEVLHLPGHTHGSAGLWEASTGTLFSGDAVYASDPLIDTTPTSSIPEYLETMRRLRQLLVTVVHPGHDFSFGRELMIDRCDGYIARRSVSGRNARLAAAGQ